MAARDDDRDREPHTDEDEVCERQLAAAEAELMNADADEDRGDRVAEPHEERVDRDLGLVLDGTSGRQEQGLADRVLQRVVGRVLGGLDGGDEREPSRCRDRAVGTERDRQTNSAPRTPSRLITRETAKAWMTKPTRLTQKKKSP
jgi:hypothetical protein